MTIIPAIDIIEGKCVRLTKGDYSQKIVYNEQPLEVALQLQDAGIRRLHLVDLDGARAGAVKNWKVLEKIAGKTSLEIDFSGGISSRENVSIAFESGAALVAIGSMAVLDENACSAWLLEFGPHRFLIGADVKGEQVVIRGWLQSAGLQVLPLLERYLLRGVRQFFCTDVERDGMLGGPSLSLYKKIMNAQPSADLIASGGIASLQDLEDLREAGCKGAIIGKALYENRISLEELKRFL